ncbi:MAG: hypothetical protein MPW15_16235 [Candidatus Manganitrophus sp.]|nr:hypothetical protein [Candidatus Manganitrophus sp.]
MSTSGCRTTANGSVCSAIRPFGRGTLRASDYVQIGDLDVSIGQPSRLRIGGDLVGIARQQLQRAAADGTKTQQADADEFMRS